MKIVLSIFLLGCATAMPYLPNEPIDGLLPLVAQIKGILSTEYGYTQLKEYFLSLDSSEPVVQEVHDFIHSNSKVFLKEAVNAFFQNIPMLAIEPGFDYPTLETLFGEVKAIILTDEGIVVLRDYLNHLHSTQPLLTTVLDEVKDLSNEKLKNVVSVLLGGIKEVVWLQAPAEDLREVFANIKLTLTTDDGIAFLREYMQNLQTSHPAIIMAKTLLTALSNQALKDILNEVMKELPKTNAAPQDLGDLFRKVKPLVDTDSGLQFIRDYVESLSSGNFLIVRMKAALKTTSNELIREYMDEVFGGLGFLMAPADDLKEVFANIKLTLTTDDGIAFLRDYMQNLQTSHPAMIMAKTLLSALSNQALKDILNEVMKELPKTNTAPQDLGELFRKVKPLVATDSGLQFIRDYVESLSSGNFLIIRMKAALKTTSDELVREYIDEVFGGLGFYMSASYDAAELRTTLAFIKNMITTKYGIGILRDHVKKMETTNQQLSLAKLVITSMSDKALISLLDELLKDIPIIQIEEGFEYPGLIELFGKAKRQIVTDEGIQFIRNYFAQMETDNIIVLRVKDLVKTTSDDKIREMVELVLGGIFEYSISSTYDLDMEAVFVMIKQVLKSHKGFLELKNYLTNLQPTHPSVIVGKAYFLTMDEFSLRLILDEFLKNIPNMQVEPGFEAPSLKELFGKVHGLILTTDGLQDLRDYGTELETNLPIVQRIKAALETVGDEDLRDVLKDLLQGFGL